MTKAVARDRPPYGTERKQHILDALRSSGRVNAADIAATGRGPPFIT